MRRNCYPAVNAKLKHYEKCLMDTEGREMREKQQR